MRIISTCTLIAFDLQGSLTSTPKWKTNASTGQSVTQSEILTNLVHSTDSGYASHSRSVSKTLPLSPNAAAFSIENLLGIERSQKDTQFITASMQKESIDFQCRPLDFSISGSTTRETTCSSLPRVTNSFHCRFCSKTYNARSSCRLRKGVHFILGYTKPPIPCRILVWTVGNGFLDPGYWRVTDVSTPGRSPTHAHYAHAVSLTGRICAHTGERTLEMHKQRSPPPDRSAPASGHPPKHETMRATDPPTLHAPAAVINTDDLLWKARLHTQAHSR
ncbi:unnamed protein product [Schistocephalus solidus]|uniref:C2H2-type domain-containing protein n=1 Tax=Schistocephalus solidus TaxID=70667 RepID=A0A183S8A8_SCHSO|nr:unnamed protein product [Schistocephalus solidus]